MRSYEETTVGGYTPDEGEEYMNPKQIEFFKNILLGQKQKTVLSIDQLKEELAQCDARDSNISSTEIKESLAWSIHRKGSLLNDIDFALARIEGGKFGFCIRTKKKIGIKRLLASPTAKTIVDLK